MKINEILTEDDYYPSSREETHRLDVAEREARLTEFVDEYVDEMLGAPHSGSADRHFGNMKIFLSIPRQKDRQLSPDTLNNMKADWRETANELIEELRRLNLGEFELVSVSPYRIEMEEMSSLYESTTAGGMATVSSALGTSPLTRNASIYGEPAKNKKKKYANSKKD